MSDEHLRALGAELWKRLNLDYASVRTQRIRWMEDVDDEGEVVYLLMPDDTATGEDALITVTWTAVDERGKAITHQVIDLATLEDVGPEKLAEMLAPDLKYSRAAFLARCEEQE